MGFTEKYDIQGRGIHEKPILRGRLPKKKGGRGAWTVFTFKGGVLCKNKGDAFEEGLNAPF